MPLTTKNIPNLIGGVSQQPDSIRFENQCEAQDNAYPSVLEGLTKRMPTEHVANLNSSASGSADDYFTHIINRDPTERYVLSIKADNSSATITVHDIDGTAKTVNVPDGTTYLQMPSASQKAETNLRAVTIADYTFIVNKTKSVAMDAAVDAAVFEAMFFVKQGDYGTRYAATAGGVTKTRNTPDGADAADREEIDTTEIAKDIVAASGTFPGTTTRFGSTIHITNSSDFTVSSDDGLGGEGLVAIKDTIQRITDLPLEGKHGFRVKITGEPTDTRDDYWVEFVADNGTGGSGHWQESRARGIKYKFDPATMPHVLVRQADGNFRFARLDGDAYDVTIEGVTTSYDLPVWGDRICGDEYSNSDPSFVGRTINDLFLFKNRLGFLADENVILTESAEFFNFWRTTVTDLLDTDPIDVASTHSTVSILTSAIPFANSLVLFSEQTQFTLQSQGALSPKTVAMTKTTNYESVSDVRPVSLGNSIYFGFDRGEYSGLRQYYISGDTESVFDATDIAAQIPQYIKGSVRDMAGSSHEDVLFVLTNTDRNNLYCYKYYDSPTERVLSSWSRMTFPSTTTVLGMEFIDTTLYIVSLRSDGLFLDKMRMEAGLIDPPFTDAGGTTITPAYRTRLDRRVDESACSETYNIGTDATTIVLPYKAYTGATIEVATKDGRRIPVVTQTNDSASVVVSGNVTAEKYWIGEAYEMMYQFSDVVVSGTEGTGRIDKDARIQIRYLTLSFSDTGYFRVEVTPDYRDTSTHVFSGRILGSANNVIGSSLLEDGNFRVPVYSKRNQVKIQVKNDSPVPTALVDADFEMSVNGRARARY